MASSGDPVSLAQLTTLYFIPKSILVQQSGFFMQKLYDATCNPVFSWHIQVCSHLQQMRFPCRETTIYEL